MNPEKMFLKLSGVVMILGAVMMLFANTFGDTPDIYNLLLGIAIVIFGTYMISCAPVRKNKK
jgi:cytochrome c biogenesis protein CcdA